MKTHVGRLALILVCSSALVHTAATDSPAGMFPNVYASAPAYHGGYSPYAYGPFGFLAPRRAYASYAPFGFSGCSPCAVACSPCAAGCAPCATGCAPCGPGGCPPATNTTRSQASGGAEPTPATEEPPKTFADEEPVEGSSTPDSEFEPTKRGSDADDAATDDDPTKTEAFKVPANAGDADSTDDQAEETVVQPKSKTAPIKTPIDDDADTTPAEKTPAEKDAAEKTPAEKTPPKGDDPKGTQANPASVLNLPVAMSRHIAPVRTRIAIRATFGRPAVVRTRIPVNTEWVSIPQPATVVQK